jgi:hypothetical protein
MWRGLSARRADHPFEAHRNVGTCQRMKQVTPGDWYKFGKSTVQQWFAISD